MPVPPAELTAEYAVKGSDEAAAADAGAHEIDLRLIRGRTP